MSDAVAISDRLCVDCGLQAEPPYHILCGHCRNARLALWEAACARTYQIRAAIDAVEKRKRETCKSRLSTTATW